MSQGASAAGDSVLGTESSPAPVWEVGRGVSCPV